MRIRSLIIHNFQSITKAKIKFTKGLNVIVGENGLGKSAILRALLWACRDAYRGTWFAKDGSTGTKVIVRTRKAMSVVREIERSIDDDGKTKTLKENRYKVIFKDENKAPLEFNKFKGQPPEIIKALGISEPIVLGNSKDETIDLNFADQHRDAIFLMNKPGSLAAKLLSRIVGIEPVLRGMRLVATERRSNVQELKRINDERDELDKAILAFPADDYTRVFKILDSKVVAVQELNQLSAKVESLSDELKEIIKNGRDAKAKRVELKEALALPWDEAQGLLAKIIDTEKLQVAIDEADVDLKKAQNQSWVLDKRLGLVDGFLVDWGDVVPAMVAYDDAVDELKVAGDECKLLNGELDVAENAYHDYLHELGVCPTCEQEILK